MTRRRPSERELETALDDLESTVAPNGGAAGMYVERDDDGTEVYHIDGDPVMVISGDEPRGSDG